MWRSLGRYLPNYWKKPSGVCKAASGFAGVFKLLVWNVSLYLWQQIQKRETYISLSKCLPWFGGHSAVKNIAIPIDFDEPKPRPEKKTSWSQLLDGVSCLSWWIAIFMLFCVMKKWQKAFFWQQWNCMVQYQKTNCPIIYDVMVESVFWSSAEMASWPFESIKTDPHNFFFKTYLLA